MRIAVMAAGAVGGYFGAKLAQAGHDVHFVARGAHLAAIREHGLIVESVNGDIHLKQAQATDNPADIGPVDIVLFAVKLWDTEKAAAAMSPLLGNTTRVISLQNGVDSYDRIAPIVGKERAILGATYVVTVIDRPGVIKQTSTLQSIVCGTFDRRPDDQLAAFAEAARAAKIDITLSDDALRDIWKKFVFLSGTSGATSITRSTLGTVLGDPDMRRMFRNIMAETLAVGKAKGVNLDDGYADERVVFADRNTPPTMKASMANDLDRGNRLELDWLAGTVSRLGRELGVPTPVNDTIYAALKPFRMGRSG